MMSAADSRESTPVKIEMTSNTGLENGNGVSRDANTEFIGTTAGSPGRPTRPRPTRLVSPASGQCCVQWHIPDGYTQILRSDWFVRLLDVPWRYIFGMFFAGYVLSWLSFALIYWIIVTVARSPTVCINSVNDFVTAFLFSFETQHTIGYGFRYVTNDCPPAIFFCCLQSILGVFLQTILTGVVLAKFLRPKRHARQLHFSSRAVICRCDGRLTLMWRIADWSQPPIVEAHVRCYVLRKHITKEGHIENVRYFNVDCEFEVGMDRVLLLWPIIVRHTIDKHSPLYRIDQRKLINGNTDWELITTCEGIVEATGMTFQSRTSFLPSEILWGHRFVEILHRDSSSRRWHVEMKRFNETYPVDKEFNSAQSSQTESSSDDDESMSNSGGSRKESGTVSRNNSKSGSSR